jgi:hypothetical protein
VKQTPDLPQFLYAGVNLKRFFVFPPRTALPFYCVGGDPPEQRPIIRFAMRMGILLSIAFPRRSGRVATEGIIWTVADNPVNEYFGGIMITLTPDEVRARFGPLFSERYLVMVDRAAGAG